MRIKFFVSSAVLAVVLGIFVFLYATRPVTAPGIDVDGSDIKLENPEEISQKLFRINKFQSRVIFSIDEVLNGKKSTVVGSTNEIAGDLVLNQDDPDSSELGVIRINARTFKTDSERRDGAISRLILRSTEDEFQFIELKPLDIDLPSSIKTEEEFKFSINGDLTISGVTQQVEFKGKATLEDGEKIVIGEAVAVVDYKDFDLIIPEVPFVADVSDEVELKIEFVAEEV